MDDCTVILLPYGLSSQYQDFQIRGKGVASACRPQHFRIASLHELSTTIPLHAHRPCLTSTTKTLKDNLKAARRQAKMGYQRNIRKSNMATAKGKEIRGRPRNKPQPPTPPTPRTTKRKPAKATKPADPQTRVGASQQLPITLDSDDDNLHVGARNCPRYVLSDLLKHKY
jgi:hypothetical protein